MTWEREQWVEEYLEGERISEIAERHEVSRKTVYKWIERYEGYGAEGLRELRAAATSASGKRALAGTHSGGPATLSAVGRPQAAVGLGAQARKRRGALGEHNRTGLAGERFEPSAAAGAGTRDRKVERGRTRQSGVGHRL